MVAPGEPLWTPLDLSKVEAYMALEASRCQGCGSFEDEWMQDRKVKRSPDLEPDSRKCYGCHELELYRRHVDPKGDTAGLFVFLRPRQTVHGVTAFRP